MSTITPEPGDHVISLWQPWASLIALGHKTIETRGWATRYRGPLIIHAASRLTGRRGHRWDLGEFEVERTSSGYLLRGPIAWPYALPLGAAVARVNLVDVVPVEELVWYGNTAELHGGRRWLPPHPDDQRDDDAPGIEVDALERPYGDYSAGRFAWLLDDIEPITKPVPMRGRQRLWRVKEDDVRSSRNAA